MAPQQRPAPDSGRNVRLDLLAGFRGKEASKDQGMATGRPVRREHHTVARCVFDPDDANGQLPILFALIDEVNHLERAVAAAASDDGHALHSRLGETCVEPMWGSKAVGTDGGLKKKQRVHLPPERVLTVVLWPAHGAQGHMSAQAMTKQVKPPGRELSRPLRGFPLEAPQQFVATLLAQLLGAADKE